MSGWSFEGGYAYIQSVPKRCVLANLCSVTCRKFFSIDDSDLHYRSILKNKEYEGLVRYHWRRIGVK